ncbi:unnamed protein product [Sympodiomycopsis kandeliae]
MKFLTSSLLLLSSVLFSSVAGQASNDDPTGKEIYMTSPSCDHYQCKVVWKTGSTQQITWLNAPKGGLKIQLLSTGDNGSQYTITEHVGSIHDQSKCKSQAGKESCGTFSWTVPANVKAGQYTVAASSIAQPNKIGYTDTVVVKKGGSRRAA